MNRRQDFELAEICCPILGGPSESRSATLIPLHRINIRKNGLEIMANQPTFTANFAIHASTIRRVKAIEDHRQIWTELKSDLGISREKMSMAF
jgi:hypothetical protein